MKRSDFLKSFGLGGAGLIIPRSTWLQKPIKIYDNYVKGLMHYHFESLKHTIKEGDALILQRELTNTYDRFAVAVYFEDKKIGYLAAYENIVIANLLEQGVALLAFVNMLNRNGLVYEALSVEVFANIVIEDPKILTTDLLQKRADDANDVYRRGIIE